MSVTGYVGLWASGKTLEMVKTAIRRKADDPGLLIFNNFGLTLPDSHHCDTIDEFLAAACTTFPIENPTELQKRWQPFGRRKLLLIDEIGGLLRSRASASWPPAGDTVFQQGRKLGIELIWTTQHWRFLDVNVRRVTLKVTECQGQFMKRLTPWGYKPKVVRPRLIRLREFNLPNPEVGELPKDADRVRHVLFSQKAANSYESLRLVQSAQVVLQQQQEYAASMPFIAELLAGMGGGHVPAVDWDGVPAPVVAD